MIDTAIILAAGLGTRMRPLTNNCPKPLISIAGRPILAHILDMVFASHIQRVVINCHYLGEQIIHFISTHHHADRIILSDERTHLLDAGGGVRTAWEFIKDRSASFIINADCLWDHDLNAGTALDQLHSLWNPDKMDFLKLLSLPARVTGFDSPPYYRLAQGGMVERGIPDPDYIFTGIQIARYDLFDSLPVSWAAPMQTFWDKSFESKRVFGHNFRGVWHHIGTAEAVYAMEHPDSVYNRMDKCYRRSENL